MKHSVKKYLAITVGAIGFSLLSSSADAWVRGGIVVSAGPAYYYPAPAYYAYPPPPYYYGAPVPYPPPPPPPAYSQTMVTPPPAYAQNVGMPPQENCREYTRRITIDGEPQKARGHACLQPDGSWKTVD